MTASRSATGLGAWEADNLGATARAYLGVGADEGLPSSVRMMSAIARLANSRSAVATAASDPIEPSVFLLNADPSQDIRARAVYAPMLDNGLERIAGRLWHINELAVVGWALDLQSGPDADLFHLVETLGAGETPAVILEPRTSPSTLRLYPDGLGHPASVTLARLVDEDTIDLESILASIGRIHARHMQTPTAQDARVRLWKNSGRCWPSEDAEALVQHELNVGLSMAYPQLTIRKEQTGIPGRLDLMVERDHTETPGQVTIFAVLELKVLRAFTHTGGAVHATTNDDAIRDGIQQAADYRQDRNARSAALCCFDMRCEPSGDVCFDPYRSDAAAANVTLRLWFIFSSARAFRRHPRSSR